METHIETGPFNKPDPTTKGQLWAEDHDSINKLKRDLSRSERNNKIMAFAVIAGVLVGGFGIWKSDTRYYMVERTPDHRKVIFIPETQGIPLGETIQYELADFIWNSRTVSTENRLNLEMRWKALQRVKMSSAERKVLFDEAEKDLEDMYKNISVMASDIIPTPRGGEHWTVEWKETYRDRRTNRQKTFTQVADVEAFYVEPNKENPGGIMFSKPVESILSEQVDIINENR